MACYAIIPARGGSKEVLKKNLRKINGKSLISRCIQTAKKSKFINKIYVSSDDKKILKDSLKLNVKIIDRPKKLSNSKIMPEFAIIHFLNKIKLLEPLPNLICFLHCTSPFTKTEDIDRAIIKLKKNKLDCIFSVSKSHAFLWKGKKNNIAKPINHNIKKIRLARQSINDQFLETGNFYIFKTEKFLKFKNRFFGKIGFYELPQERSLNIDSEFDINLGNFIAKKFKF